MPTGDAKDNSYVSRTGQNEVPVQSDEKPIEDPIDPATANSDETLGMLDEVGPLTIQNPDTNGVIQRRTTQKPLTRPISSRAVPEELSRKGAIRNQTMRKEFLRTREFRAPDSFEKRYHNVQDLDAYNTYYVCR